MPQHPDREGVTNQEAEHEAIWPSFQHIQKRQCHMAWCTPAPEAAMRAFTILMGATLNMSGCGRVPLKNTAQIV